MKSLLACLAAVALVLAYSGRADACVIVMDFQVLAQNDALLHDQGKFYSEDGFTLEAEHPIPGNAEIFRTAWTYPRLVGALKRV